MRPLAYTVPESGIRELISYQYRVFQVLSLS